MKQLFLYKENGDFVIERTNEFNHSVKRFFVTEEGLFEGIDAYKPVLDQYEINVSDELQPKVTTFLSACE